MVAQSDGEVNWLFDRRLVQGDLLRSGSSLHMAKTRKSGPRRRHVRLPPNRRHSGQGWEGLKLTHSGVERCYTNADACQYRPPPGHPNAQHALSPPAGRHRQSRDVALSGSLRSGRTSDSRARGYRRPAGRSAARAVRGRRGAPSYLDHRSAFDEPHQPG